MGLAISDPAACVAQPLTVLERPGERQNLSALVELINEYSVDEIVIGYPKTLGGEVGPQAQEVDRFIDSLSQVATVPVVRYDERFSSKEARAVLGRMGVRGKKAKGRLDQTAAAIILQSYLDKRARKGGR